MALKDFYDVFTVEESEQPHMCPVCGKYEFPYHGYEDFCEVCGWWDDAIMEANPDSSCGGNSLSLNEARKVYKETGSSRRPRNKEREEWNREETKKE